MNPQQDQDDEFWFIRPDIRTQEQRAWCRKYGYKVTNVEGDNRCGFYTLKLQLLRYGIRTCTFQQVRYDFRDAVVLKQLLHALVVSVGGQKILTSMKTDSLIPEEELAIYIVGLKDAQENDVDSRAEELLDVDRWITNTDLAIFQIYFKRKFAEMLWLDGLDKISFTRPDCNYGPENNQQINIRNSNTVLLWLHVGHYQSVEPLTDDTLSNIDKLQEKEAEEIEARRKEIERLLKLCAEEREKELEEERERKIKEEENKVKEHQGKRKRRNSSESVSDNDIGESQSGIVDKTQKKYDDKQKPNPDGNNSNNTESGVDGQNNRGKQENLQLLLELHKTERHLLTEKEKLKIIIKANKVAQSYECTTLEEHYKLIEVILKTWSVVSDSELWSILNELKLLL